MHALLDFVFNFVFCKEDMRDHMERFAVLPFSIGCASQSSVDVVTSEPCKKTKPESKTDATRRRGGEESSCKDKMKSNTFAYLPLPKPNIFSGIHKLVRGIKSISQIFVYKEENEEAMEREMEIGFPTDVKHVTHIGLDGTTTTNTIKGWESLKPPEIISFPSISLRQFELAMAAQAHVPLVEVDHSRLA